MTDRPRFDGGGDGNDNGDRDCEATPPSQSTYELTDDRSPSETVVRAVAALTNTPALELEPLYNVIDPAQLDELYEEATAAVQVEFSFTYGGCAVTVTRSTVRIRKEDEETDAGS